MSQTSTWVEAFHEKMKKKLEQTSDMIQGKYPYTTTNGKYENLDFIWEWYAGFWCGMLWLMYQDTGDEKYLRYARQAEEGLDEGFEDIRIYGHDVGFVWGLSAVADYKITGNESSKRRGYLAACALAARYNVAGGFIRAQEWPAKSEDPNDYGSRYCTIIDCMMNLPLLYWASDVTEDDRFAQIAMHHADKTMKYLVRGDGSVEHCVEFHKDTGQLEKTFMGQGFSQGSSWSRGQAWAIYGFALSYAHTGKREYLETAKRVAHYFLANLDESGIVPSDFRAPKEPFIPDTTAGACAACGLLEIADHTCQQEKGLYIDGALKILRGLEKYCDFGKSEQSILQEGSEAYHYGNHMPIIYGDYFLLEALHRLCSENKILMW